MQLSSRGQGSALLVFGVAVLAWLSYDAGTVQQALGLEAVLSEAAVALGGLVVSGLALGLGFFLWRQGARSSALR